MYCSYLVYLLCILLCSCHYNKNKINKYRIALLNESESKGQFSDCLTPALFYEIFSFLKKMDNNISKLYLVWVYEASWLCWKNYHIVIMWSANFSQVPIGRARIMTYTFLSLIPPHFVKLPNTFPSTWTSYTSLTLHL